MYNYHFVILSFAMRFVDSMSQWKWYIVHGKWYMNLFYCILQVAQWVIGEHVLRHPLVCLLWCHLPT